MLDAPQFTLSVTGGDPKLTSKSALEGDINSTLQALLDLLNIYIDQGLNSLEDTLQAVATGLQAAGDWDASSGSFPASADLGTYYLVSTAGTVDGVSFGVGDWLIPLQADASTTTYAGNWATGRYSQVLEGADGRGFDSIVEASAATDLEGGQWIVIAGRHYETVAAGTHTADGDTVLDLTGSELQAVRAPKIIDADFDLESPVYVKSKRQRSLREFRPTGADPSDWLTTVQAAADSGERVIYIDDDIQAVCDGQITISAVKQVWKSGSREAGTLIQPTSEEYPFIVIDWTGGAGGFRFKDMGIKCNGGRIGNTGSFNGDPLAIQTGILVRRTDGGIPYLDIIIDGCYINGFDYGIDTFGHGVWINDNHLTGNRYAWNISWPDPSDFSTLTGPDHQPSTVFRKLKYSNNYVHTGVGSVRNRGYNAANVSGLTITDNYNDVGQELFVGDLGRHSRISDNTVINMQFPALQIDGGDDYLVSGNTFQGDVASATPMTAESFITIRGDHFRGKFIGNDMAFCERHGIDIRRSGGLDGTFQQGVFANNSMRNWGLDSGGTYSGILMDGDGHSALVDGFYVSMAVDGLSAVQCDTGSSLEHHMIRNTSGSTPATNGSGTITAV